MNGGTSEQGLTVEGDLAKTPLGHVLIYCLGKRLSGTFVVYPDPRISGDPNARAAILLRGGLVVGAQVPAGGRTVLEALAPLCAQAGGRYAFYNGQDLLDTEQPIIQGTGDPRAVVAHALRHDYPTAVIDRALEGLQGQHVEAGLDADFSAYGLRPEELSWAAQLASAVPVDTLLRGAGLLPVQARRMLYLMRITKAITVVAAPASQAPAQEADSQDYEPDSQVVPIEALSPPADMPAELAKRWKEIVGRHHRLEHDNCFQVLGLPMHANTRAASVAFAKLSKRWSPDALPPQLQPMQSRAQAVYARMGEAHRILSDPGRRIEYLADLEAGGGTPANRHGLGRVHDARTHRLLAGRKLRERDFDAGLLHAHLAVAADDTNPEAIALYSYLRFEVGGRDEQLVEQALANLAMALEVDPGCALAHRFRGVLLEHAHRPQEAVEHYARAMTRDPDDVHSASRWRALSEAQQRESQNSLQDRASSVIGKLFGKLG